ncbi:DUF3800 domain-containing protein [Oleomonas cavernae]|uniref:DUF3800 domain-containing protein n=1 Tax=Oleomonas cavernae TaxID=2320859 RepID=A0A418WGI9_9PROT|nr:DUF3800 domain-containing protein [Oleomonas cavernae]RJF89146.1 DUF3800 domain-containing protein [Oleomonas cavernae]
MTEILQISCDEAGHTGPDLLEKDQRYFTFASVSIPDPEAFDTIQRVRALYPVQMPELKASRLMASRRGRKLILELLKACEGRYIVSLYDKLLALCGWFFEYIYEPVYQHNPRLLYEKNLHRFVAMYAWLWMSDGESNARGTIEQFQKYMRTRDPADAPFLFDSPRPPLSPEGQEHPFETVLRFAYGYRDTIIADNAQLDTALPDGGRWTLDLSASGLWSHLNYWGAAGKPLSVRCDVSKPLQSIAPYFTGDERDPGIRRARMKRHPDALGWRLFKPIDFVDSRNHPAVQLADVVAGTAAVMITQGFPTGCEEISEAISRHVHEHSILPDLDVVNLANRSAAVNALILYDLAKRAERQGDPYENLEQMYRIAEVSWVRGDYNLMGDIGQQ